jgi:hypothetical protein
MRWRRQDNDYPPYALQVEVRRVIFRTVQLKPPTDSPVGRIIIARRQSRVWLQTTYKDFGELGTWGTALHIRSKHSISHGQFAPPSWGVQASGSWIAFLHERPIRDISGRNGYVFPGIIQGSRVMCAQSELAKLSLFVDSCPMKWVLGLQLYIHSFTAYWANPAVRSCNSHLMYWCHLELLNIIKYGWMAWVTTAIEIRYFVDALGRSSKCAQALIGRALFSSFGIISKHND